MCLPRFKRTFITAEYHFATLMFLVYTVVCYYFCSLDPADYLLLLEADRRFTAYGENATEIFPQSGDEGFDPNWRLYIINPHMDLIRFRVTPLGIDQSCVVVEHQVRH